MLLKLKLKISNFIKDNRRKILIIFVIWAIIFIINYYLGHRKKETTLNTTYTPHEVVMSNNGEIVPESLQEPIEKLIDDFVKYCNNKEYNNAYALLSDDCKENVFDNQEDNFKIYVDEVFPNEKIYSIQSYSTKDDFYIYNVKILNNILASGLTDEEFSFYEEKYAISKNGDDLKLTVGNYMGKEELKRVAEDDNVKIRVVEKIMFYSKEIYTVRITNKTENIMVIADGFEADEIYLRTESEGIRGNYNSNLYIVLEPGETKDYKLFFTRYYDESSEIDSMIFDKIRILESYSGRIETKQEEIDKAIKKYSLGVPLK